MTGEGRVDAVAQELRLADEELAAGDALIAAGMPRQAIGRAYFAAWHAARARLASAGLEPRTHSGTRALYSEHFIKRELAETGDGRLLARLQKYREEADYSREFVIDLEGAAEELAAARALVARTTQALEGAT